MNVVLLLVTLIFAPPVMGGLSRPVELTPADPTLSGAADWRVEPVVLHGGSAPPDIGLDAAGRPYVLACPPGEVRYALRWGDSWIAELVTETVGGGICGALGVAADGTAYVNFYIPPEGMPSDHRFAVRDGSWLRFPIPTNAADLAVDSMGAVHGVGWLSGRLTHIVWRFGAWTLEDTGLTGFGSLAWTSMALDALDNPHVLFYTSGEGDVRYAFRDSAGWHVEVVEHVGALNAVGRQGSLALDSHGNPYASYVIRTQPTRLDTFYAIRSPAGWAPEFLANGYAPSLSIQRDGAPVVAYKTGFPGMGVAIATRIAGTWSLEAVPDPTSGPAAAQFPTMVLDRCDSPHLAWYDFDVPGVLYATKGGPCAASPHDLKNEALQRIEALEDKAFARGDKKFAHELDKAASHVRRSLASGWLDGSRLDPKHGKHVFSEEKHAVRLLVHHHTVHGVAVNECRLKEKLWTPAERASLNKECDAIAKLLVKADETLAVAALEEAKAGVVPGGKDTASREAAAAERALAAARAAWADGRYGHAIEHFKHAWQYAQHAIGHAAKR